MTRTKKLCCVDKANVLKPRLWRETVQAMEKDYPEVTVSEFVDAVAMRLVQWLIPMMY
jgi:3-isopropylmalate dehydrogenase